MSHRPRGAMLSEMDDRHAVETVDGESVSERIDGLKSLLDEYAARMDGLPDLSEPDTIDAVTLVDAAVALLDLALFVAFLVPRLAWAVISALLE